MKKHKRSVAGRCERIDVLTATLPKLECKRLCQECCGPVMMSAAEAKRIAQALGYEPQHVDLTCPMLCRETGACRVYAIRPLICRLWGLVKAMACPHGCEPERWLTDAEAGAYLSRVEHLGN